MLSEPGLNIYISFFGSDKKDQDNWTTSVNAPKVKQ